MTEPSKKDRNFFRVTITSLLVVILLALIYLNVSNNIHTVIKGQVYRSAQLSAPMFIRIYERDHIKTIINLRGKNPSFAAYQNEIALSQQLNLQHYDVRLPSTKLPSVDNFHKLIYLLEHAQKPILLHCKSGADRSGLASAIALELNGEKSLSTIEHQFSLAYFVTSSQSIGKLVFHDYEIWLKQHHYKNNKKHFLTWAYSQKPFNIAQ